MPKQSVINNRTVFAFCLVAHERRDPDIAFAAAYKRQNSGITTVAVAHIRMLRGTPMRRKSPNR